MAAEMWNSFGSVAEPDAMVQPSQMITPDQYTNYTQYQLPMQSCMYGQGWYGNNGGLERTTPSTYWNGYQNIPYKNATQVPYMYGADDNSWQFQQVNTMQQSNSGTVPAAPLNYPITYTSSQSIRRPIKGKRTRTAFTTDQVQMLEARFQKRPYISREERSVLKDNLSVTDQIIKVWFQNRRLKEKRLLKEKLDSELDAAINAAAAAKSTSLASLSPDIAELFSAQDTSIDARSATSGAVVSKEARDVEESYTTMYEPISPPDSNKELVETDVIFEPFDPLLSLQCLLLTPR